MTSTGLPTANLFGDPFADPSVKQAATSINDPSAGGTQDINSDSIVRDAELFRREEEMRKREQELQRRQREFDQRQAQMGNASGPRAPHPHNWPPLPTFIPMEPCFYQDIDVEIPVQFQETVRLIYNVYLVYILALATNLVGAIFFMLFAAGGIGLLFLSIVELGIFTPCAYMLWFRPVYKAFRDDSSFNFMMFFMVLFFHTIFCLFQALGVTNYSCGWSNTIGVFDQGHFMVGLAMLIPTLAFTVAFIGMAYSLIRVHRFYRGAGFSLDKAREEFSRGVMSDRNVQNAASSAARAAATHVMNETIAVATPAGGRY